MHYHIWSFCGICANRTQKQMKGNIENLVSPTLTNDEIKSYFNEIEDETTDESMESHVILPCVGICPNPKPFWLYIRDDDALVLAIRPQHWVNSEGKGDWSEHVYAKAYSDGSS